MKCFDASQLSHFLTFPQLFVIPAKAGTQVNLLNTGLCPKPRFILFSLSFCMAKSTKSHPPVPASFREIGAVLNFINLRCISLCNKERPQNPVCSVLEHTASDGICHPAKAGRSNSRVDSHRESCELCRRDPTDDPTDNY